jgi:hypothetical protein
MPGTHGILFALMENETFNAAGGSAGTTVRSLIVTPTVCKVKQSRALSAPLTPPITFIPTRKGS